MIVISLLLILAAVAMLGTGLARGSNVLLIGSIAASLFAVITLVAGVRQAAANRVDDIEDADDPDRDPARGRGLDLDRELDLDLVGDHDSAGAAYDAARRTGAAARDHEHAGALVADPMDEPLTGGLAVATDDRPGPPGWPGAGPPPAQRGGAGAGAGHDSGYAAQGSVDPPSSQSTMDYGGPDEADDEDPPDEPTPQLFSVAESARISRMSIEVLVIDGRPRYHLAGCVHLLGRITEPLPVSEVIELGFTPCSLCEPVSALLAEARRV